MLLRRGQAPSKRQSRRLKFVDFCIKEGFIPIPIPTTLVTCMKFMIYIRSSRWKLKSATEQEVDKLGENAWKRVGMTREKTLWWLEQYMTI